MLMMIIHALFDMGHSRFFKYINVFMASIPVNKE